ncbi:MAG: hypothetical protein E7680_03550 [Ruminococcaceae bacterium]|nr:hypothetical protein [Oscillospiraceae bacterium]
MKRTIALLLVFVCVIPLFFSCAEKQKEEKIQQPEQLAFGTYRRPNDDRNWDFFSIALSEKGTYSCTTSMVSSNIIMGDYTYQDGIVTLTHVIFPLEHGAPGEPVKMGEPESLHYQFRYTKDRLIFLAETSDPFSGLPDQAEFTFRTNA